jgi:hypothetical protein
MSVSVTRTTGGQFGSQSKSDAEVINVADGGLIWADVTVPANSNMNIPLAIDVSALEYVRIKSDVACMIEATAGALDTPINLAAGVACEWRKGSGQRDLFNTAGTDVAELKLTNSDLNTNAALSIIGVQDLTP